MGLRDFLQWVFSRQTQTLAVAQSSMPTPTPTLLPAVNHGEIYIASHLADIEIEAVTFAQHFGPHFNDFLYQPDIANFIRQQVLAFRYPGVQRADCLDNSYWQEIHYLNFPGPFYTGNSDTCDTGPYEAPNNVLRDNHAMEFIFRQPQNFTEFLCTLDAAAVEALDSYACDGNEHWTYRACQEWWRSKAEISRRLSTPAFQETNGSRTQLYIDYLNGAAETDLRKYCYFLENGRYPTGGESLPPL